MIRACKKIFFLSVSVYFVLVFDGQVTFAEEADDYKILREIILNEFQKEPPSERGQDLAGVANKFNTKEKKAAFILTACSEKGTEMDAALLKSLSDRKIPAAVFADQAWLKEHAAALKPYMKSGYLTLENHGLYCRGLSVEALPDVKEVMTTAAGEVFEEVEKNARLVESVSGRLPRFFKAANDRYDDISLKIVTVLGYVAVKGDLSLKSKDVESLTSIQSFLKQIQPGSLIVIPVNLAGTSAIWAPQLLDEFMRMGYQALLLDDAFVPEDQDL